MTKAAIDALSFDEKLILFAHWFTTLPNAQKNQAYEAAILHPDNIAWLSDKIT
jgi:hypothetical protein